MKQITVTLNVDEASILAESGLDNLEEAISRELGWLHDSGISVEAWSFVEEEKEPPKVNLLCEEFEDNDGIREFTVLAVSDNAESLRKLMYAKILGDEYGYIADKGIDTFEKNHFATEFSNGFVEYYIQEDVALSQKALEQEIQFNSCSISKDAVINIISEYIDDLENLKVMPAEMVNLIMDHFSREELEELGLFDFLEVCLMTEADLEEVNAHAKSPLDQQIAKAEATKVPVKPAGTYQKDSHAQERG